jgi:hypothetical protein
MVKNKKDVEKAQHKIDSVLKELGLEIYTNEEFYKYIEDLNKKKIAKIFNYKTYKENYFKKKYGL